MRQTRTLHARIASKEPSRAQKNWLWSSSLPPSAGSLKRCCSAVLRAGLLLSPALVFASGFAPGGPRPIAEARGVGPSAEPEVNRVLAIDFSPDGRWLASVGSNGITELWDLAHQEASALRLRERGAPLYCVLFGPNGRRLAVGGRSGIVNVWDLQNLAKPPEKLHGHTDSIAALAFDTTGRHLGTISGDGTARIWDLSEAAPTSTVVGSQDEPSSRLALGRRGNDVLFAAVNLPSKLLDHPPRVFPIWRDGEPGARPFGSWTADTGSSARFSSDGLWLATLGPAGTVRVWETEVLLAKPSLPWYDKRMRHYFDRTSRPTVLEGHPRSGLSLAFSPDGQRLFTGGIDGNLFVWDLPDLSTPALGLRAGSMVRRIFFSDDARWMAAVDSYAVYLWQLERLDEAPIVLADQIGEMRTAAFSPDSRLLATGGTDSAVRLWALPTGDSAGGEVLHVSSAWEPRVLGEARPPTPFVPKGPPMVSGDIKPPKVVRRKLPEWPASAKAHGVYGHVHLLVTVGVDGSVLKVKPVRGLPMGVTRAAMDAVSQWRYKPATLYRKPIEVQISVRFSFGRPPRSETSRS